MKKFKGLDLKYVEVFFVSRADLENKIYDRDIRRPS